MVLYAVVPLMWIVSLSFKTPGTVRTVVSSPKEWTFENYTGIFEAGDFTAALRNSIGIGLITTFIAVLLGTMAAYAVARLDFPGKKLLIGAALLIAMFPQVSLVTPMFNIERAIGLFDTLAGPDPAVHHVRVAAGDLHAVLVLPGDSVGAGEGGEDGRRHPFQAFTKVIAPLAAPGVVTAAILVFIFAWNDLLLALSLTSTNRAITAPVAIANFTGSSQFEEPTGSIAAAAVVITIPIIIFVLFFQRRIVAGLTSGAVKDSSMADIVLDKVSRSTPDGSTAVHEVNIDIADGEFIILVGPSGCGKSTTLNMIAGLEDITSGELRIGGERVNERAPGPRHRDGVPELRAVSAHVGAAEHRVPAHAGQLDKDTINKKVEEAARILDLTSYLDRKPANLSGGQRQRVAMGRAIVRSPRHF